MARAPRRRRQPRPTISSTSCCSRAGSRRATSRATAPRPCAISCPTRRCSPTWTSPRRASPMRSSAAKRSPSSAIMTSTARPRRRLLMLLLRRLGADPMVYIPDRLMEGYGPSGKALVELQGARREPGDHRRLRRAGVRRARRGRRGGARRDRLRPSPMRRRRCPTAIALINPNRLDESAEGAAHGHLAAVGMAFLLGVALLRELRRRGRFSDGGARARRSSTCSTSSRSAPSPTSRGSRRSTAPSSRRGSRSWPSGRNIGLVALAEAARLVKAPSCRDLGFALGPRINAGGRVGKSDLGVRLLTATDPEEARDHRRRARPPQRGTPRDRDARRRAGRASKPRAQANDPLIIVAGQRLARRRGRDRRQPPEGTLRPPGAGHRARRRRHRQGLGPLDQRGRPWRRDPRRQGQRPARRRAAGTPWRRA